MLEAAARNLLDPAILFFVVGVFAGLVRSNLEVPQAVMKSVYDYSTDPRHMEEHRERLARALAR